MRLDVAENAVAGRLHSYFPAAIGRLVSCSRATASLSSSNENRIEIRRCTEVQRCSAQAQQGPSGRNIQKELSTTS